MAWATAVNHYCHERVTLSGGFQCPAPVYRATRIRRAAQSSAPGANMASLDTDLQTENSVALMPGLPGDPAMRKIDGQEIHQSTRTIPRPHGHRRRRPGVPSPAVRQTGTSRPRPRRHRSRGARSGAPARRSQRHVTGARLGGSWGCPLGPRADTIVTLPDGQTVKWTVESASLIRADVADAARLNTIASQRRGRKKKETGKQNEP